jgi:hypothetical protein
MVIEIENNWAAEEIERLKYLREIQRWYLERVNDTLLYKEEQV